MRRHLRRGGVITVVLLWAFVWSTPGAALEALSNLGIDFTITSLFDIWPIVLAIPGAIGGVAFTAASWSPDGRRRLDHGSIVRLSSLGGLIGFIIGLLAFLNGVADPEYPVAWTRGTTILGLTTTLGIAAALVTALAFRHAPDGAVTLLPESERRS